MSANERITLSATNSMGNHHRAVEISHMHFRCIWCDKELVLGRAGNWRPLPPCLPLDVFAYNKAVTTGGGTDLL